MPTFLRSIPSNFAQQLDELSKAINSFRTSGWEYLPVHPLSLDGRALSRPLDGDGELRFEGDANAFLSWVDVHFRAPDYNVQSWPVLRFLALLGLTSKSRSSETWPIADDQVKCGAKTIPLRDVLLALLQSGHHVLNGDTAYPDTLPAAPAPDMDDEPAYELNTQLSESMTITLDGVPTQATLAVYQELGGAISPLSYDFLYYVVLEVDSKAVFHDDKPVAYPTKGEDLVRTLTHVRGLRTN
jgi:hypothetical protein